MPERTLQTTDEVIGGLAIDRFRVAFAAVAEHDPQQVRPTTTTVLIHDRRGLAKVHLSFRAGLAFQSPKRQLLRRPQMPHEAFHAVVAMRKIMVIRQVLENSLRGKTLAELLQDHIPPRLAPTPRKFRLFLLRIFFKGLRKVLRPGGQLGLRPGGHFGRF